MNLTAIRILLVVVGLSISHYEAYDIGKQVRDAFWLAIKAKQDETVIAQQSKIAADEHKHAIDIEYIATQLENTRNENQAKDHVIADLRAGVIRLRKQQSESATIDGEIGASAGQCDAEARTELSAVAFEEIYRKFGECDDIAEQLNAAQQVILRDRSLTDLSGEANQP